MMRRRVTFTVSGLGVLLALLLGACNFAVKEAEDPTAMPQPAISPVPAATAIPTPEAVMVVDTPTPPLPEVSYTPSRTPSPSPSLTPSHTPTRTPSPTLTPLPSDTPTPAATPATVTPLIADQFEEVSVDSTIRYGLDRSWFAILSVNERTDTANLNTPEPGSQTETLYLVNPASEQRVQIIEFPSSTNNQVYWAPDGSKLLYYLDPALLEDGTRVGGLYLLNLNLGFKLRLYEADTLNPRGIPNLEPIWSPDSSRVAVVMETGYHTDIFVISGDEIEPINVTADDHSFNLWPAWSPDGTRLAYVSDRADCPSWVPGEPESCSALDAEPPTSGRLYVLDLETGVSRQVSEIEVDAPPSWISNSEIVVTTGLSAFPPVTSHIWLANIESGIMRDVTAGTGSLNLGAAWAPNGGQVVYHQATEPASIVLRQASGTEVSSLEEYPFRRYGFAADWSTDGEWVAFAGTDNICPYGLIVARSNLEVFWYEPYSTINACDPSYSPDGSFLAFAGIQVRSGVADGRLDLYVAQPNGAVQTNLTNTLRGEIRLLGWVGPG
ncbi:MAG: hypothetical protein GYB65_15445 [Chloroflexi bacterium]|nr:hypothetical protein [Chloroflexota bacterium]